MGRTTTPLVIWVEPGWEHHPLFTALVEKGHGVMGMGGMPDLILAPCAHQWDATLMEKPAFLEMALKAARARKKGKP